MTVLKNIPKVITSWFFGLHYENGLCVVFLGKKGKNGFCEKKNIKVIKRKFPMVAYQVLATLFFQESNAKSYIFTFGDENATLKILTRRKMYRLKMHLY